MLLRLTALVVELATVRDRFLELRDAPLQVTEPGVGLELGVVLDEREQPAEPRAELLLGGADRGDVALPLRAKHGRPRLHHALERLLLVRHVALAGFHQLRQFLVTLREQDVDVGPGLAHVLAQRDQPVVDPHAVDRGDDEQRKKEQRDDQHRSLRADRGTRPAGRLPVPAGQRLDYGSQKREAFMTLRAYLDRTPSLGPGAYVDPTALVIGDVTLGADASVWPMTVIRGDVNHIRVGARSNVQDGSVLHVSRPAPGRDTGWPLDRRRGGHGRSPGGDPRLHDRQPLPDRHRLDRARRRRRRGRGDDRRRAAS